MAPAPSFLETQRFRAAWLWAVVLLGVGLPVVWVGLTRVLGGSAQARSPDPVGWGIRRGWGGRGWAYTVSGNRGVLLELADGRHVLLGSQRRGTALPERTTARGSLAPRAPGRLGRERLGLGRIWRAGR